MAKVILLLLKAIAALPRPMMGLLAGGITGLTLIFSRRDCRIIAANIDKVYKLPAHSAFSKMFVRQNIRSQINIMLETIKYIFRPQDIMIEGLEEAKALMPKLLRTDQMQQLSGGALVITAHVGSWELAGHFVTRCVNRPFYVLAKPSKAAWMTPVLEHIRSTLGMNVLWTGSKSILSEMVTIVNRGDYLGFVMDQRPGHRQGGHPCDFLGIPNTPIVHGPVLMAVKKNLPAVGCYLVRTGRCRYRVIVTEILPPNHGLTDEGAVAQMFADDMSNIIKLYPEQWSWNYRRWKS